MKLEDLKRYAIPNAITTGSGLEKNDQGCLVFFEQVKDLDAAHKQRAAELLKALKNISEIAFNDYLNVHDLHSAFNIANAAIDAAKGEV